MDYDPTIEEVLFGEELTEATNKGTLADELPELKADYEDFGPEGLCGVSYDNFKRNYPEFTKKVLENFLLNYVEATPEELADPEFMASWQTRELITDDDWPYLFDYAERVIDGRPHQWKDICKVNYDDPAEESLTEDTKKQGDKWVNKGKEGTHGDFKTKKAADAQRKAMFANGYKAESLKEDFQLIQLTQEDQAMNIRSLIKACWENVDEFSAYAQQLNEFGSQQALEVVNSLINDLYVAIGSFEDVLTQVDTKSTAIDAPDQIEAVAALAPQTVNQLTQLQVPVIEKFTLDEGEVLNEDIAEKPEVQQDLEEPVEKELKEVEKYRKEKIKDSLNPDTDEVIEETSQIGESLEEPLGDDDSFNPQFYESLLKLEN